MGTVDASRQTRSALILYGSETGTAQDVAEELGAMAERLHFMTHVVEMDSIIAESLASFTVTVFVVSTTGQGDFPANSRTFWRSLLLKRLPPTFLGGVNFTIFGLGDSSYPKFNWAARKLHKRLIQLGANETFSLGEADQQHSEGLEGTLIPWSTSIRQHLLDRYPLPNGLQPIPDDVQLSPKWVLELPSRSPAIVIDQPPNGSDRAPHAGPSTLEHDVRPIPNAFTATLVQNRRLTPAKHWQDVRHICLSTPSTMSYGPGDVISITPKNFPEDVETLIDLMGWTKQADEPVDLAPAEHLRSVVDSLLSPPIHDLAAYPGLTLRKLITDYLDIRAIPRRSFFSAIAHYTHNHMHKERLLEFTKPEYIDEFWDYTTRPRRSILEVLYEFDSVKVPWQHAVSVFPLLRGRQFSIASGGGLKHNADGSTNFELLVAIVKYKTVIKSIREGVCTRYLSVLRPGSTLRVQLQRGGLTSSQEQLLGATVLIGPGTGVAPLRSMLWEKAAMARSYQSEHFGVDGESAAIGRTILLYGGRNRNADFYFEDEWKRLAELEPIDLQVLTAFSRDQGQKIYVQDVVRENKDELFRLLHDEAGSVYICGSSGRMPQAVREALTEVFQYGAGSGQRQQLSRQQAEEYLVHMEKVGRYKQETW